MPSCLVFDARDWAINNQKVDFCASWGCLKYGDEFLWGLWGACRGPFVWGSSYHAEDDYFQIMSHRDAVVTLRDTRRVLELSEV
jgi:hypothetical protein